MITINEDPGLPTAADAAAAWSAWEAALRSSGFAPASEFAIARWGRAWQRPAYPSGYAPGDQPDADTMALRHRSLRDFTVLETVGLASDAMRTSWLDLRLVVGRHFDFRYFRGERHAGSWRVPLREFVLMTDADFFGDYVKWPEIITIEWDDHPALVALMGEIRANTLGSAPNDWTGDQFRCAKWRAVDEQGDRVVSVRRRGGRWRASMEGFPRDVHVDHEEVDNPPQV